MENCSTIALDHTCLLISVMLPLKDYGVAQDLKIVCPYLSSSLAVSFSLFFFSRCLFLSSSSLEMLYFPPLITLF